MDGCGVDASLLSQALLMPVTGDGAGPALGLPARPDPGQGADWCALRAGARRGEDLVVAGCANRPAGPERAGVSALPAAAASPCRLGVTAVAAELTVRAEPAAAGPAADHARGFEAHEAALAEVRQVPTGALMDRAELTAVATCAWRGSVTTSANAPLGGDRFRCRVP